MTTVWNMPLKYVFNQKALTGGHTIHFSDIFPPVTINFNP